MYDTVLRNTVIQANTKSVSRSLNPPELFAGESLLRPKTEVQLSFTSMLTPNFSKGWPSANVQSRDKFQENFGRKICRTSRSWIVVRIGPGCLFCLLWSLSIYYVGGGFYLCVVDCVDLLQAAWSWLSPSKPKLFPTLLPGRGETPFSWSLPPPPSRGFQIGEPRKKWNIMGFKVCSKRMSTKDFFAEWPF